MPLSGEPIGRLDQKHVARPSKDLSRIPTGSEITLEWQEIAALLLPDEKERRPGPVLPAHDGIAAQRVGSEIRVVDRKCGRGAGSVGIDSIGYGLAAVRVAHCHYRAAVVSAVA